MNAGRPPPAWLKSLADPLSIVYLYLGAAGVAAFAFTVSYSHIYDLGRAHAQSGTAGRMLPLSVDLLIVVASLVLFRQSRQDEAPAGLARWLPRIVLWSGIAATVGANLAYGLPSGWLSGVISGWPGYAFVAIVETVMVAVRPGSKEIPETREYAAVPAGHAQVPANSHDAAAAAYAASAAGGNALTEYQLHRKFGISRGLARKIVAPAAAGPELNGDGPRA